MRIRRSLTVKEIYFLGQIFIHCKTKKKTAFKMDLGKFRKRIVLTEDCDNTGLD